MKRFNSTHLALVALLSGSVAFADDYKVNTLPRQISSVQEVIEVDISEIMPGQKLEVDYREGLVWIYRRTQKELDFISKNYTGSSDANLEAIVSRIKRSATSTSGYLRARLQLVDQPELEKSPYRSKVHEYFVFRPLGRLGCTLNEQLPSDIKIASGAWLYDPCFNQIYDLAGRFLGQQGTLYSTYTGEKVASNREVFPRTVIPPHSYKDDGTLVIGVADISTTPEIFLSEEELYANLTPTEIVWKAAPFNDIVRVQTAINEGADVTSNDGRYPDPTVSQALRNAVLFGSAELVELILTHGAIPNKVEIDTANRWKLNDIKELLDAAMNR